MREIKFRAWDKLRRKMILTWKDWPRPSHEVIMDIHTGRLYAKDTAYYFDEYDSDGDCNCTDMFILEQYTGAKDSAGREIYEGDIYLNADRGDLPPKPYIIEFSVGEDGDGYPTSGFNLPQDYDEYLGNIHENPELLKEMEGDD